MDSEKEMRFSDANSSKEGDLVVAAAKRSYECTFCKRGFTNAQALGGHMNRHRKDRAKEKRSTTASSVKDYMINVNPRSLQPSSLNHDELLGANLSLRIDLGETEQVRRRIMKEDEVDLELRLGYDP